jgi:folate-binding protein YgfZ
MLYATIACLGPDAETFLQGQLSCDMRNVFSAPKLTLACYCNLKGRIIAAPYVYAVPDGFHLLIPADLVQIFLASLQRVVVFSKAKLTDISSEYPISCMLGQPEFPIAPGIGFGQEEAPSQAWQARCIELGLPVIGKAQSGLFLPHDIDMVKLGAVSFSKGCYVGQEIIARMHYKGKLKKHLVSYINPLDNHGVVVNEVIFEGKRYTLVISSIGNHHDHK